MGVRYLIFHRRIITLKCVLFCCNVLAFIAKENTPQCNSEKWDYAPSREAECRLCEKYAKNPHVIHLDYKILGKHIF